MRHRDEKGVFRKVGEEKRQEKPTKKRTLDTRIDHNYTGTGLCDGESCSLPNCSSNAHIQLPDGVCRSGWRDGRRIIELGVLLDNLKYCAECKLGPVPLTSFNVVGELQKGLSGYLYVVCQNPDCQHVNRVAYGKQHHMEGKARGMPCFDVNTKLGTGALLYKTCSKNILTPPPHSPYKKIEKI